MIADELRAVLKRRSSISNEWYDGIKQCCEKEVEILTRKLDDTIGFLDNECTASEFIWISEVFDELVAETQSRDLIACFYRVAAKYPEESDKYYIVRHIQLAEEDFLLKSKR